MPLRDSTNPDFPGCAPLTAELTADPPGSVLVFARYKYYWSPARIFRAVCGISTNLARQIEILRIMNTPAYVKFSRSAPRFRWKFLIRDYLVRGFSTGQRAACFLHHYRRLHATMSADLLRRTLYQKVTVFEARYDDIDLEISLCFSRPFEKEGELSLNLHVDRVVVFVLSFTIIPGWVVESESEEVLLISRLQGTNGYYGKICAATKVLHNVGPAALLLAALHGFAKAYGIDRMAAVSAVRQSSFREQLSGFYESAYDSFFSSIGASKNASGLFLSSIPPESKPMSSIKRGHRSRTRDKRQFKHQLAEDVCLLLQHESGKDSEPARAEEPSFLRMLDDRGGDAH